MSVEPTSPTRVTVGAYALVTALSVLASSAVSVVIPQLASDLELGAAGAGWVLASFSVTFPIGTVLFGQVADRIGPRRTWAYGSLLFIGGGVIAATAPTFTPIVIGRLIQGVGAGAIPVLTLARLAVGGKQQRATRVGFLTAVVSIHSGAGPLLGGALAGAFHWRATLALPLLTLLVAAQIWRDLPDVAPAGTTVDWAGAASTFAVVATPLLLLRQLSIGSYGAVAPLLLASVVAVTVLVVRVRRRPDGFLRRELITDPHLVGAGIAAMCLLAVYLGGMFAVPLLLADALGWGPFKLGLGVLPAAVIGMISARLIGRYVRPQRWRLVASGSMVASLIGLGVISLGSWPPVWVIGLSLLSLASMAAQVVHTTSVLRDANDPLANTAIGTFQLFLFSGGAFGPVVVGAIADRASLQVGVASSAVVLGLGVALPWMLQRRSRRAAAT